MSKNSSPVKIEYSPNTPQGFTKSPSFLPNKWVTQATLEGLYQNVVYTISIRFVVNNVEGPSESISVAVSDNHGRFPQKQTCQVPTYLRPEALRVKRGIFGDPKMEVTWEHPRAKTPENGYRLVFAPFASISAGKPMIVDVDKNVKTVKKTSFTKIIMFSSSLTSPDRDTILTTNTQFPFSHFMTSSSMLQLLLTSFQASLLASSSQMLAQMTGIWALCLSQKKSRVILAAGRRNTTQRYKNSYFIRTNYQKF